MTIQQNVDIHATKEQIYETLLNSEKFSAMTGGKTANIEAKSGGALSLFDGMIEARNIELIQNKRIVQAWRVKDWPEGQYSLIRFELDQNGANTTIHFTQTGHPEEAEAHLDAGWHKMYWEPMNKMER
ncbi:SRPBCC domain-containing protein [Lentilitoribacter sp. EG35]|uniref:SRPBCC domain-containing protein n=1 Tax=Lentilitoribacter sp. EG35 TaxID=3234192 RepID=UPI00345FA596